MKLGIGLPNTLAHEADRRLMLDWARQADQAGFHTLGVIDKLKTQRRASPGDCGSVTDTSSGLPASR